MITAFDQSALFDEARGTWVLEDAETTRLRGEVASLRAELAAVRSELEAARADAAAARGQLFNDAARVM